MAERTLKKRRPAHLPVVVLRPSIIMAAIREPMIGWTDTLSAAGGLSLAGGVGVLEFIYGKKDNIADIVPVDYVSNSIIVSTAIQARKPPALTVVHSNTSHMNPITWENYLKFGFDYMQYQPVSVQVFRPSLHFIDDYKTIKTLFYLRSQLPTNILEKVTSLPLIGNPKMNKQVKQLQFAYEKLDEMYDLFQHFTRNNWVYETKKIYEFLEQMSAAEKEEFYIDPKTFDWMNATHLYAYGTESYMFKEDRVAPDGKSLMLLHKNQFRYFDDVQRVMKDIEIICRDPARLQKETLA